MHTTFGDLDVELWCRECPQATRNFLQLAMEGYYDNTVFHRLIKDFMLQGGDPTGTGTGGESIYGKGFADEIHSRIRFKRRGLLAMANENKSNSNHSQFFITLGECSWLDRKHTIFGKITGKTVFNLMRANEYATDKETDRPLSEIKIIDIEVLNCPFDIIPRSKNRVENDDEKTKVKKKKKKKKKKKSTKNLNLISFGEEEEEEIDGGRMKSLHEVTSGSWKSSKHVTSKRIDQDMEKNGKAGLKDVSPIEKEDNAASVQKLRDAIANATKKNSSTMDRKIRREQMFVDKLGTDRSEQEKDAAASGAQEMVNRMRDRLLAQKRNQQKKAEEQEVSEEERARKRRRKEISKLRSDIASVRRDKQAVDVKTGKSQEKELERVANAGLLSPLEIMRRKFLDRKKKHNKREESTLERLKKFRSKLSSEKKKNKVEDSEEGWMNHSLKFVKHWEDSVRTDDYVTIDPLRNGGGNETSSSNRKRRRHGRKKDQSSEHIPMHLRK